MITDIMTGNNMDIDFSKLTEDECRKLAEGLRANWKGPKTIEWFAEGSKDPDTGLVIRKYQTKADLKRYKEVLMKDDAYSKQQINAIIYAKQYHYNKRTGYSAQKKYRRKLRIINLKARIANMQTTLDNLDPYSNIPYTNNRKENNDLPNCSDTDDSHHSAEF